MRANRYVSYLAAEIEPKALANMRSFEREAEKTMGKISRQSGRGSAGFANDALGIRATRNAAQISAAGQKTVQSLNQVDAAQRKVSQSAQFMGTGLQRAAAALGVVQGPLGPLSGRLSALGAIMRTLTGFSLAGVLAGGGAFALGGIATQYQQIHDRLAPLYDDQKKLNAALNDVVGIAQRTRQALAPVAELYSKITLAGRDQGFTDERSSRVAEIAAKAARLSGGAAQTQEAGLTQFSQGFGSGTLAGEELKSVRENTLRLAKAIADGLDVPMSALKELAKEGKLTPQVIADALENSAAQIETEYARMPKRIGTSLTELSNSLSLFIGRLDEAVGATSGIASVVSVAANNLDILAVSVGTVAAAFAARTFAGFATGIVESSKAALAATANYNLMLNAERALMNSGYYEQRARLAHEAAVTEQTAARTAITSGQQYQAQLRNQIGLIDKQIAAQRRAVEMARTLDAASRSVGGGGRGDLVKAAQQDLNASMRARILTQQQLVAVDAELAAADARLAAATLGVSATMDRLVIAETAAAAATGRLATAKMVLAGVMAKVTTAAVGLVGFLGGPWGVAFTLAAGVAMGLATSVDAATAAAQRFGDEQGDMAKSLGFATNELYRQTDAARELALALAEAEVTDQRRTARKIKGSLAGSLSDASLNLLPIGKSAPAFRDLRKIVQGLQGDQVLTERGMRRLLEIQKQFPGAFRNNPLGAVLGSNPADTMTKLKGYIVGVGDVKAAEKELDDVRKNLAKPRKKIDLEGGGAKPPTKAQLNAQARTLAATSDLDRAKAELAEAKLKGPEKDETNEAYISRIAGMIRAVDGLKAAHKGAASAKSGDAKAQAALNKAIAEAETASDKRDRLSGIMDRFTVETPIKRLEKLRDEAEKAKRAIDDLVGERVEGYDKVFSQEDADGLKAQVDSHVEDEARRPVRESIEQRSEELRIQRLIGAGRVEEAEFVRRRLELEKQVGPLLEGELDQIRGQIIAERELNDTVAKRSAIIENNAQFLAEYRDAGRDMIRSFLGGDFKGGIKGFITKIKNAFLDAKANELAIKIFGDPEKKYRDAMTQKLDSSADNLTGSATDLKGSAGALDKAALALQSAAEPDPLAALPSGEEGAMGEIADGIKGIGKILGQKDGPIPPATGDMDEVVVTARRAKIEMPPGIDKVITDLFGNAGGSIVSGVAGMINSTFGGIGEYGGTKGAGLSDALGGIAQMAAQFFPQMQIGMAVTSGLSKLLGVKNFAGGAFGIVGNLVAKAFGFGKATKGSTTVRGVDGAFVTSTTGKYRDATTAAGGDVESSIQRIVDALGGTIGNFAVSIGMRDNGEGPPTYRVDPTGRGRTKNMKSFGEDYEAALKYAIMDAIKDGAIAGIRESTQRLLQAGKDLDSALEKALKFEGVFKRLKRLKDPVGAAVDELNVEFRSLIKLFKEAGATAEEWAQLEELYGLERAEAIKQATDAAVSTLKNFIQSLTSGPESPLSRRTVYDNARGEVDRFVEDIMAGRPVDQAALVQALENFQSASAELNGSREQFFTDFAYILDLAERALGNVPTPTDTSLPPSPFDTLTPIAEQQLDAQNTTNSLLGVIASLIGGLGGTVSLNGGGSTLDGLPATSPGFIAEAVPAGGGGGGGGATNTLSYV